MHPKTVGLIAHTHKKGVTELLAAMVKEFESASIAVLLESETAALLKGQTGKPISELARKTDLLVVFGGDGTILNVADHLADVIKPIFGINVGSLGFSTSVSSDDYREAVKHIAEGRLTFSERTMLEVRADGH